MEFIKTYITDILFLIYVVAATWQAFDLVVKKRFRAAPLLVWAAVAAFMVWVTYFAH